MGVQSTKSSFNGTFELADNFPSCCQLRGKTTVYVNRYYEVEKFDNRKSQNYEKDHFQSKKRIQRAMRDCLLGYASLANIALKPLEGKSELKLQDVRKVNRNISEIFEACNRRRSGGLYPWQ
jgi:hypothetical protein